MNKPSNEINKQLNKKSKWNNYVFDIETCLAAFEKVMKHFPKMTVKVLPADLNMEHTPLFYMLLGKFNEIYDSSLSTVNVLTSRSSFLAFYDFLFLCHGEKIEFANFEIKKNFMRSLNRSREIHRQNLRSMERFYDEIVRELFYKKTKLTKADEELKTKMYYFEQAYSLMKLVFKDEKRDSWERYFEHLKWVMEILLREMDKPNLNKIIIALLHDVQEDLPEYADVVRKLYGDYIADWVNALSKKPREQYITEQEKEVCWKYIEMKKELMSDVAKKITNKYQEKEFMNTKKIKEKELVDNMDEEQLVIYNFIEKKLKPFADIAKERRNKDYFWHLDDLCDDYLDVKFADRIHNLRDRKWIDRDKAIRKVEETEKYFLHVALKRNREAYDLMMIEIKKNREEFGF